jgi:hypothetical protein
MILLANGRFLLGYCNSSGNHEPVVRSSADGVTWSTGCQIATSSATRSGMTLTQTVTGRVVAGWYTSGSGVFVYSSDDTDPSASAATWTARTFSTSSNHVSLSVCAHPNGTVHLAVEDSSTTKIRHCISTDNAATFPAVADAVGGAGAAASAAPQLSEVGGVMWLVDERTSGA